jgi:hypothetical protein
MSSPSKQPTTTTATATDPYIAIANETELLRKQLEQLRKNTKRMHHFNAQLHLMTEDLEKSRNQLSSINGNFKA